jgi:hypothetical protein
VLLVLLYVLLFDPTAGRSEGCQATDTRHAARGAIGVFATEAPTQLAVGFGEK